MERYPSGTSLYSPIPNEPFRKTHAPFGKASAFASSWLSKCLSPCFSANGAKRGPHVTIVTDNHDLYDRYVLRCRSVVLEDNVWVGAGASIMPGVRVGKNAVIAGGAVVTKDVPANTIVGGSPAKVIREIPEKSGDETSR